jgi:hypothetical protein
LGQEDDNMSDINISNKGESFAHPEVDTNPEASWAEGPVLEMYKEIEKAINHGRPVVPLLGAGVSAESGVPMTAEIVSLLAAFLQLNQVKKSRAVQRDVSRFDRQELNDEIGHYLSLDGKGEAKSLIERAKGFEEGMNRKLMCCNGNSQLGSSVDHLESTLKKIKEFAKRLDEDERRKFDRRVPDLDQMTSELERAAHAEWRVLLRKVAGHRPEKVDYILDRLIRGWSPSTPHRFVAFLARALGWKLILTTNFDTLIEQALRENGLEPVVYEIRAGGNLPDTELVKKNLSVIKLHGGAYSMRADETLDEPLNIEDCGKFGQYLPPRCLLLVVGYGGGDRRVYSLLDHFVRGTSGEHGKNENDENVKVIWVYRDGMPKGLEDLLKINMKKQKVVATQFRDAAELLRGLYVRLKTAPPAGSKPYRALVMIPPPDPPDPIEPTMGNVRKEKRANRHPVNQYHPIEIFASEGSAAGTSTALSQHTRNQEADRRVIWCSMDEIPSVHTLVATVLDEIRVVDHGVADILVPSEVDTREPTDDDYALFVDHVVNALVRGNYFLAIDSVGEHGRGVFEHHRGEWKDVGIEKRKSQINSVYRFLCELIKKADSLGRSRIGIAFTQMRSDKDKSSTPETSKNDPEPWAREFSAKCREKEKEKEPLLSLHELQPQEKLYQALRKKILDPADFLDVPKDYRDAPSGYGKAAKLFFEGLQGEKGLDYKVILSIAASHRRPVLLSALRILGVALLKKAREARGRLGGATTGTQVGAVLKASLAKFDLATAQGEKDEYAKESFKDVDDIIDELNRRGLLVRQGGAYYWMHHEVRKEIYESLKEVLRENPGDGPAWSTPISNLHDSICHYYYKYVYLPSQDIPSLFEYLYHRIASIRPAKLEDWPVRLQQLAATIQRERDRLLSGRDPFQIFSLLMQLQEQLDDVIAGDVANKEEKRVPEEVTQQLLTMQAELMKDASRYDLALKIYQKLINQLRKKIDPDARETDDDVDVVKRALMKAKEGEIRKDVNELHGNLLEMLHYHIEKVACEFFRAPDDLLRSEAAEVARGKAEEVARGKVEEARRKLEKAEGLLKSENAVKIRCPLAKERLSLLKVRCLFRLMECLSLGPCPDRENGQSDYVDVFKITQEELRVLSGIDAGIDAALYHHTTNLAYHTYNGFVNCLRARADSVRFGCPVSPCRRDVVNCPRVQADYDSLRKSFDHASLFLDAGRTSLLARAVGGRVASMGVYHLFHAECLLCHAECLLCHAEAESCEIAESMLDRTLVELGDARERMAEGRTYVRWWTKYYILNARYFAMRLLLDRKGGHTKDRDEKYRAERYKMRADKFKDLAVQTAKDWDLIFEAQSI